MADVSRFERVGPGEDDFVSTYLDALEDYQKEVAAHHTDGRLCRGFHKKTLAAAYGTFHAAQDLPSELRVGVGAVSESVPAVVRFSSGQSFAQPDFIPDIRGLAVKILDVKGQPLDGAPDGVQDLLAVNANNHSIRDGETFARLSLTATSPIKAAATASSLLSLSEQMRLAWEFSRLAGRTLLPLSRPSYFGAGPIAFGDIPAKFRWVPENPPPGRLVWPGHDSQRRRFCQDLMKGPLTFDLAVQLYVDEAVTPVEDLSVKWDEQLAPPRTVGTLHLPPVQTHSEFESACEQVEDLAFSPWNCLAVHKPLGNLQRIRRLAYAQSAARRGARPRP